MALKIKVHEATSKSLEDALYNAFASEVGSKRCAKLSGDAGKYDVTLYDLEGNRLDTVEYGNVVMAANIYGELCLLLNKDITEIPERIKSL